MHNDEQAQRQTVLLAMKFHVRAARRPPQRLQIAVIRRSTHEYGAGIRRRLGSHRSDKGSSATSTASSRSPASSSAAASSSTAEGASPSGAQPDYSSLLIKP